MSTMGYQEPSQELPREVRDMHHALVSLAEELEAIDAYNQRASTCEDETLKAILHHNRDDEKEHAAMLLEWLGRTDAAFGTQLRKFHAANGRAAD